MGTVWEARHLSLETQIAIKFLNADLSRRQDVLARFAREATSAARIRSPHVVSILDSGFTDDGQGFIAMELLRGEDLSRRLARDGKLTVGETSLLVTQVSRGLAKAHAVGVVHRDLKPENIFVIDEDGVFAIKILDFGIAKSIGGETATHKTDTGQLLGTPLYMSPEQALGRPLDSRSDLYSLAVLAYRCLTGRPPFMYPAVGELIVAVSTHVPPPPSRFNAQLPASLDDWFAAALAKDPVARICQTASEVADSFKQACGVAVKNLHPSSGRLRIAKAGHGVPPELRADTEQSPAPSSEETATTISARHAAVGPSAPPPTKRLGKWRMRALLAAVAASAIVAGFGFRSRSNAPASPSRAQSAPASPAMRMVGPRLPSALPLKPASSSVVLGEPQPKSSAAPSANSGRTSPRTVSDARRPADSPVPPAKASGTPDVGGAPGVATNTDAATSAAPPLAPPLSKTAKLPAIDRGPL